MEEEPKKKVKREATPAQLENLRKAREAKAAKKAAATAEPVSLAVEENGENQENGENEENEEQTPPAPPPVKKVVLKKTPLAKKAEATVKRVKKQQAHAPTSREMKAAIQQARRAKEQAEEKQHSFDALVEQKVRAILREKAKAEALARQQAAYEEENEENGENEENEENEENDAPLIDISEEDEEEEEEEPPPPAKPKRVSNHVVQFQPEQQQPVPPWMTSVYARDPYMVKMAQRLGYS